MTAHSHPTGQRTACTWSWNEFDESRLSRFFRPQKRKAIRCGQRTKRNLNMGRQCNREFNGEAYMSL